jgi:hypothetical protein
MTDANDTVGPVLTPSELTSAVVAAICEAHPNAQVVQRGGYVRVLVPLLCRVSRDAIERYAGAAISLPVDLEQVMPSFKGQLRLSSEEVSWSAR